MGIRKPRFYDWKARKGLDNQHNGFTPKSSWILPHERKAILSYFSKNEGNGCRRLAYMMNDEDIVYVSPTTVHRVLKAEGLIDNGIQSPTKKGTGFEQPIKPHTQWHIDISYINAGGTFYYLCSILDGFSRFIVQWDLQSSMQEDSVEIIVQKALEKFNLQDSDDKPRLISDNGSQFKAKEFKQFIKLCGMGQSFTAPYYPQSNGKIERWHRELKSKAVRPIQPRDYSEAYKCIEGFIENYNYKRLHSAIGYVTPFDKLLGLDAELQSERKRKMTQAQIMRKAEWQKIQNSELEIPLAQAV